MANASTTQTSSACGTTGTPIPLAYGYAWATGKRAEYYELQNTGNSSMDYTRVGIWLLGHGEWDGCTELWINDVLTLQGGTTSTTFGPSTTPTGGFSGQNWVGALDGHRALVFNFHSGCDSTIGAGLTPVSSGPDQGVDVLWGQFPSAINPLAYSRIAYYAILRKQAIQNQTNDHDNDPTQWGDIAPIGLWRTLRCRLFDDQGNQTGYAFTTNPAWHLVDVLLRRKLMPDYGLALNIGPDELTTAVQNRFDWGSIYTAAQFFDEILANGNRRFQGNYVFSTQTTLQAVLEQILLCCRSYTMEYAGKISLNCDMPRSSVFTFSRSHILPGSWGASDQTLHKSGNRYLANYRDLLVPECSQIESISFPSNTNPVVTTTEPHPFNAADRIAIGGTNTVYDGEWVVLSVPDVINPGTPEEVDPTTFTLTSKGSNYPASVGAVGGCGLLYSRFKERTPEFWHKTNMLARGAVGAGIPRQRSKVKQSLDFATTTFDQASRLTCYERDRLLGLDQTPYITPPCVKLRTSMFARDASGNLACAIRPGDHVTLDDTTNFLYAGEYEVLEPLTVYPPAAQASGSGGEIALKPTENSGEIEFALGPYNEAIMYDTSDPAQGGWPSVPGSYPGNDVNYTQIPLANGGSFVFFTGQLPSGQQFQLPSTGFPPNNLLAWASPAGASIEYHTARVVQICAVAVPSAATTTWVLGTNPVTGRQTLNPVTTPGVSIPRQLTLIYNDDEGTTWSGDVNYAALSWLSSDETTASNGLTWLELTLPGGEVILFGEGVLADEAAIELPAGYSQSQAFAVSYIHEMPLQGNNMFLVGSYVDADFVVHLNCSDDAGHVWHGNSAVLVFAWKNNMGSVSTQSLSGGNWMQCTLSTGQIFGVGCAKNMANGATFVLPTAAGDGSTLEAMVGSSDGNYETPSNHAQGVGSCYLDAENIVHITFQDGSGEVWPGQADVFALYCSSATAAPTLVTVMPATASVAEGATQQFSATIANNANPNVTWSVDGIAGGNVTVGTISAAGLYTAPSAAGSHTITATSVAVTTASGSTAVTVWSGDSSGGGWTINGS
jgi:hypothetical protein